MTTLELTVPPGAREQLLDTASEIMREGDIVDVSLSDLSTRSGLNSALVKYYFGNKAGLLKALLERDPPYSANVQFTPEARGEGWNTKPLPAWLESAVASASLTTFGAEPCYWGEGGSIPFIGMLARRFPDASFVVTGALGPDSNAHGPNEFLDLDCAEKVTACIAQIVAAHAARRERSSA
jgi:AcrR family transcriptional regulator